MADYEAPEGAFTVKRIIGRSLRKLHDKERRAWDKKRAQMEREKRSALGLQRRRRYSDARTAEGKALRMLMDKIVADLGGMTELNAGQVLILGRVREKLIVLMQIGKYVDEQESVIRGDGDLLPCLGKAYISYSETVRRDVVALYDMARKKGDKIPDLEAYLKAKAVEGSG